MQIDIIETTSLGDRSYLISADDVAVVVDPQRDIDRVLDAGRRPRGAVSTSWRPTCTTTTSPAAWSWPARRAPPTSSPPATRCSTSASRRPTAT